MHCSNPQADLSADLYELIDNQKIQYILHFGKVWVDF